MSELIQPVTRRCSSCRIPRVEVDFESPKHKVCTFCATDPGYARIMDRRIREAGAAFRRILDKNNVPKFTSAPKMNDMLVTFFERWGGQEQFIADVVKHGKELLEKKSIHIDTTRFLTGMLKLVNENNKRQDAVDVAQMTDEQLKQEQQTAMLEMLMEAAVDPAKSVLLNRLLEAFNLPQTVEMIEEVKDA